MTDFVVVGGGIAGVAAAAFLSPHGSVTLLEMESSLAYHTSGRSAAMLVENYGSPTARPLVKAARPFLEKPPEGSVDGPLLSERPILWVADSTAEHELEAIAAQGDGSSGSTRRLERSEVMEVAPIMDPDWVSGGFLEKSGADIDVAALHQAFVRIARRNGAEILTNSAVLGMTPVGTGWEVQTRDRSIQTRAVINAAGAWGDEVARAAGVEPIGLQPYRRTAFMVPGDARWSHLPLIVEVEENWYVRPDGVQFLCSLAEENPSEPTDARPRMEDVALAIERINQATTLDIRTVNSQWTGLRTFSRDRGLVIGEDPETPGFFWLVGQGGIGIQTSPAYGALIASQVIGAGMPDGFISAGVDPDRVAPARFRN